ncbi:MAG: YggT family protein [Planctomycetes bacterium]|nr:YggT family protein [Planctomycetota bacterium]
MFLATVVQLYSFVLLARVILSWIPSADPRNPIVQFLYQVTEPVLAPVRAVIPPLGMMDISPIVVFLGLQILHRLLLGMAGGA